MKLFLGDLIDKNISRKVLSSVSMVALAIISLDFIFTILMPGPICLTMGHQMVLTAHAMTCCWVAVWVGAFCVVNFCVETLAFLLATNSSTRKELLEWKLDSFQFRSINFFTLEASIWLLQRGVELMIFY